MREGARMRQRQRDNGSQETGRWFHDGRDTQASSLPGTRVHFLSGAERRLTRGPIRMRTACGRSRRPDDRRRAAALLTGFFKLILVFSNDFRSKHLASFKISQNCN